MAVKVESGQLWIKRGAKDMTDSTIVIINCHPVEDFHIVNFYRMIGGKSEWTVTTLARFEDEYVMFDEWRKQRNGDV